MPASTTTTIKQDEIPGGPSSAMVRRYSLKRVGEMKADFLQAVLSDDPPCVVGVSLGLAGSRIQTLALATREHVFNLAFHRPPSLAQTRILRRLLSKVPLLTGFELPYTIVLLAHALGCNISGRDLSTLDDDTGYRQTPGAFIEAKVPSASRERINTRWEKGMSSSDTKSTDTLESKCAVRAWFTAM
jgi:hypothetical protein